MKIKILERNSFDSCVIEARFYAHGEPLMAELFLKFNHVLRIFQIEDYDKIFKKFLDESSRDYCLGVCSLIEQETMKALKKFRWRGVPRKARD